jgi:SAM-dependent methyltransferase
VPPPPRVDPDLVTRLHADLERASYTVDGVRAVLGPVADAALDREQALPADLVTRTNEQPAAALIRCFALGMPVPASRLRAALPAVGVEGLARLGLIEMSGDEVRATCDLRPYGDEVHDWWLASDLSEIARGAPLPEDHVLGVGPASVTVAQWTPRRPVPRALDLGTGCGVQALHLAGHAQDVVATDLSARALAYARFNLALPGIEIDLRHGDLLEPVAGERFDLIVSNPPFVITPRRPGVPSFEYRDAGLVGDELVRRLVRDVGDHLTPGGVAVFIGNWEVSHGQSWRHRWAAWLDGTGLDAYVVQRDEQDPAEYAELWAGDAGSRSGVVGFEELYASWLEDFSARGIERIGFGVVVLQRPATSRRPWTDFVEHTGSVDTAMGPAVDARLRARTWLAEHTDEDLLATAWQLAADVTEERHFRPVASDPEVIQLRQGGGVRPVVRLDTVGAGLVSVCDGTLSARAALEAIAVLLDQPADAVISQALPLLKDLVTDGLLHPTLAQ